MWRTVLGEKDVADAVTAERLQHAVVIPIFAERCEMRLLIALVFCSAATLPIIAQKAASNDDASVRESVRQYVDAREKRDPKLLAALFTEDADQITTSGEWRRGRESVVKGGWLGRRTTRAPAGSLSRPFASWGPVSRLPTGATRFTRRAANRRGGCGRRSW